jgi:hypothetical protein
MTEQNYKFLDIVSGLFLLIILSGNYLGLIYITEGNIGVSAILSLGLMVYYYYVIDQLKKNKEVMFKSRFRHPSMILWAVFLVLFGISFLLMSHFINVEYNAKKNIQNEAQTKIAIVSDALNQYNGYFNQDKIKYKSDLDALMNIYVKNESGKDSARIKLTESPFNVKIFDLYNLKNSTLDTIKNTYFHAYDLKNTNVHDQINKHVDSSNNAMLNAFLNWSRININDKYGLLNFYVKESINSLNESIDNFADASKYEKIAIPVLDENLPINSPFALKEKYHPSPIVPIIVLILTHVFLLIPFYFQVIRQYSRTKSEDKVVSTSEKPASKRTQTADQEQHNSSDNKTQNVPKKGVIEL